MLLARGELQMHYALSDLALSQSERASYRQQTKGIWRIGIIILLKCKVYSWNYMNTEKYILPFILMNIILLKLSFSFLADPCYHYSNLSDANRNREYKTPRFDTPYCDKKLPKRWYRFVGAAGTKMPTTRVPAYRCGTDWSGWLMTAHPSVEDGKVNGKVCFSARTADSNCEEKWSIFVKNRGLYYIYELLAPNDCPKRFCGTGEKWSKKPHKMKSYINEPDGQ